jgi:hypothetical protein
MVFSPSPECRNSNSALPGIWQRLPNKRQTVQSTHRKRHSHRGMTRPMLD